MAGDIAQKFIYALHELESGGDTRPMEELFSEDVMVSNYPRNVIYRGRRRAERFWSEYRHSFQHIHSDFNAVFDAGETVILEWRSQGYLPDGRPIDYRGVTILEVDQDKVFNIRIYYDTAPFLSRPGEARARTPQAA